MEPRILARSEHPISRRDIDANVLKVLYRLAGAGAELPLLPYAVGLLVFVTLILGLAVSDLCVSLNRLLWRRLYDVAAERLRLD